MRLTQIIHLMEELGIDCKPKILTDSQSMLASIKGRIYRGTAVVHIATKYHLAADMVRDGEVEMEYIPSDEMIADMLTKELPKPSFLKQCMSDLVQRFRGIFCFGTWFYVLQPFLNV